MHSATPVTWGNGSKNPFPPRPGPGLHPQSTNTKHEEGRKPPCSPAPHLGSTGHAMRRIPTAGGSRAPPDSSLLLLWLQPPLGWLLLPDLVLSSLGLGLLFPLYVAHRVTSSSLQTRGCIYMLTTSQPLCASTPLRNLVSTAPQRVHSWLLTLLLQTTSAALVSHTLNTPLPLIPPRQKCPLSQFFLSPPHLTN